VELFRLVQDVRKKLAEEITVMVHSREAYDAAVRASQILFGKATQEQLQALSERELLEVFKGVPQFHIDRSALHDGLDVVTFLAEKTDILPSKGEARRTIKGGGLSINKAKVKGMDETVTVDALLSDKYILVQKGKKHYYLVLAE